MTATRTEDRLVAALQARADQVRPEDLAPFVAPEPGRSRPRWGVYALAAAALAAVVAAPLAVDALRSTSAPPPGPAAPTVSADPSPSADASPTQAPAPKGRLDTVRGTADVDGDRRPDAVTMTYRTGREVASFDLHVSVTLATGATSTATADVSELPMLVKPRDIDNDGRELLIVRAEGGDSDVPQLFAYRQGRLQHLATAQDAPALTNGIDADGRLLRWWFDGEGRMFSARSVQPMDPQSNDAVMRVYRWFVGDAPGGGPVLDAAPSSPQTQCFNPVDDETPHPC